MVGTADSGNLAQNAVTIGVVVPEFVQPETVFTRSLEEGLGCVFPDSSLPCSDGGLGGTGVPGITCALARWKPLRPEPAWGGAGSWRQPRGLRLRPEYPVH